ncbi:MAG: hypothetical protein GY701_28755 [Sulfitobacter sp.]|nr:hypothetical protein [Sulfitobacter sp.]
MADIDTSKIEAVNTMLSLVGVGPVNSLTDNLTPGVAIAIRVLEEKNRELQSRGWHWNTDRDVTASPDDDSKFPLDPNWIRFDVDTTKYTSIDIVRRGEFLYDVKNATDVIDQEELEGTAVLYLDWDDIPETARNYIMIRAARAYGVRIEGNEFSGYTAEDELRAWVALEEAESEQADYNYLDTGAPLLIRRRQGMGIVLQE